MIDSANSRKPVAVVCETLATLQVNALQGPRSGRAANAEAIGAAIDGYVYGAEAAGTSPGQRCDELVRFFTLGRDTGASLASKPRPGGSSHILQTLHDVAANAELWAAAFDAPAAPAPAAPTRCDAGIPPTAWWGAEVPRQLPHAAAALFSAAVSVTRTGNKQQIVDAWKASLVETVRTRHNGAADRDAFARKVVFAILQDMDAGAEVMGKRLFHVAKAARRALSAAQVERLGLGLPC